LTSLRADYDQQIKALVALSAIAEPELRSRLAARVDNSPNRLNSALPACRPRCLAQTS